MKFTLFLSLNFAWHGCQAFQFFKAASFTRSPDASRHHLAFSVVLTGQIHKGKTEDFFNSISSNQLLGIENHQFTVAPSSPFYFYPKSESPIKSMIDGSAVIVDTSLCRAMVTSLKNMASNSFRRSKLARIPKERFDLTGSENYFTSDLTLDMDSIIEQEEFCMAEREWRKSRGLADINNKDHAGGDYFVDSGEEIACHTPTGIGSVGNSNEDVIKDENKDRYILDLIGFFGYRNCGVDRSRGVDRSGGEKASHALKKGIEEIDVEIVRDWYRDVFRLGTYETVLELIQDNEKYLNADEEEKRRMENTRTGSLKFKNILDKEEPYITDTRMLVQLPQDTANEVFARIERKIVVRCEEITSLQCNIQKRFSFWVKQVQVEYYDDTLTPTAYKPETSTTAMATLAELAQFRAETAINEQFSSENRIHSLGVTFSKKDTNSNNEIIVDYCPAEAVLALTDPNDNPETSKMKMMEREQWRASDKLQSIPILGGNPFERYLEKDEWEAMPRVETLITSTSSTLEDVSSWDLGLLQKAIVMDNHRFRKGLAPSNIESALMSILRAA